MFVLPEYMNQSMSETSRSSRLSEVLNPNYEDLSPSSGIASLLLSPENLEPSRPEYLNTAELCRPLEPSDSLENPDYQAAFLPPTVTAAFGNGLFLPTAENLEYLGLNATQSPPVR